MSRVVYTFNEPARIANSLHAFDGAHYFIKLVGYTNNKSGSLLFPKYHHVSIV